MRVKDVMTCEVHSCRPGESLAAAARVMWDHDCGCVPIVDDQGSVVAVLTDRDVCMAAFLTGQPIATLAIASSMSRCLIACGPEDSLDRAECLMREHRVRRLPVVGMQGHLVGMLTLNDLAQVAGSGRWHERAVSAEAIESTLMAIGKPARHV